MYIVQVHIRVKPEFIEAFKTASPENARESIQEPGVVRFDVLQQPNDPTRFLFMETYCTSGDPDRHKATAHYQRWRQAAEPMMAEPRARAVYFNLFPGDEDY